MNWLVMKLVFATIPTQPMPFFVRPVARALCAKVQQQLIDPNLATALGFIEAQLSRASGGAASPHLQAYLERMRARPAYQRALAKGGPVMMAR